MQDPNYSPMFDEQATSLSTVQRVLKRMALTAALLYALAVFLFVSFFIYDLSHTSTTRDTVLTIAIFLASIPLMAWLTRRQRLAQARRELSDENSASRKRWLVYNWLSGIALVALAVAFLAGLSFNSVIVEAIQAFAVGNAIVLLVQGANKG